MNGVTGFIYLLHLSEGMPIREGREARHYLGWSEDLDGRMREHGGPTGAAMLRAAKARGISWQIVRVWRGDRNDERAIKKRREAPRFCPICVKERQDRRGLLRPNLPEIGVPS